MKLLAVNPSDVFGQITPPAQLQPFINKGGAGAGGINLFLNNLITLIYMVAAVVFVFMLLISAFQWLSSGGDKEKVAGAQRRITNAIIGIVLFAIAFAILRVVGVFTGFSFVSQQDTYYRDPNSGNLCVYKRCPSGINQTGECTFQIISPNDPNFQNCPKP